MWWRVCILKNTFKFPMCFWWSIFTDSSTFYYYYCNWESFSYLLAFCFRSIFWTCSEINGLHPTIFQELNNYYLCCSIERKNMGVGTQVHLLEKEHTSGWWVLLYNQQAYSGIQGLKHNCFLLGKRSKNPIV